LSGLTDLLMISNPTVLESFEGTGAVSAASAEKAVLPAIASVKVATIM